MRGSKLLSALFLLASATAAQATSVGPFLIFFDTGSSRVTPPAAQILDNTAMAMRQFPEAFLVVGGHADRTGSPDANRRLSCARAMAVRAYLIAKGISAARLIATGYGSDRPLVETGEGVAEPQNRSVEMSVTTAEQANTEAPESVRC